MNPEISVIIPTYEREQVLLDSVAAVIQQQGVEKEIILVDQTRSHEPAVWAQLETWRESGEIRWISQPAASIPKAMNRGAQEARAPILLYLDDDIEPDPGLLRAHRAAHHDLLGELISGRVLQPWHAPEHDSAPFTLREGEFKQEFMGGNFSIARLRLIEMGGFDENFRGAAYRFEREFAERLLASGYRIWYEPSALVHHLHDSRGGTRSRGDHLTSWCPHHPVGAYYYLAASKRVRGRAVQMARRLFRSVLTRHHLRRPWYIPVTLVSEVAGLAWALRLRLQGPALPFSANSSGADSA